MVNPFCSICGHDSGDILHVLQDYTAIKDVWSRIILGNYSSEFFF